MSRHPYEPVLVEPARVDQPAVEGSHVRAAFAHVHPAVRQEVRRLHDADAQAERATERLSEEPAQCTADPGIDEREQQHGAGGHPAPGVDDVGPEQEMVPDLHQLHAPAADGSEHLIAGAQQQPIEPLPGIVRLGSAEERRRRESRERLRDDRTHVRRPDIDILGGFRKVPEACPGIDRCRAREVIEALPHRRPVGDEGNPADQAAHADRPAHHVGDLSEVPGIDGHAETDGREAADPVSHLGVLLAQLVRVTFAAPRPAGPVLHRVDVEADAGETGGHEIPQQVGRNAVSVRKHEGLQPFPCDSCDDLTDSRMQDRLPAREGNAVDIPQALQ